MQRVTLTGKTNQEIHCPFCGKITVTDEGISTCDHLLLAGCHEGLEFIHPALGLEEGFEFDSEEHDDIDLGDFLEKIEYPGVVLIEVVHLPPNNLVEYVAYSNEIP